MRGRVMRKKKGPYMFIVTIFSCALVVIGGEEEGKKIVI